MTEGSLAPRLRRLPVATILGREVRVASAPHARLLGLAHLDLDQAGAGLLIPRCTSVHTFGMRFRLDIYFLAEGSKLLAARPGIPARRVISCRGAEAILEIPASEGGEFSSLCP
jgi:uncharacterized membrane protein (UPF0127 family)